MMLRHTMLYKSNRLKRKRGDNLISFCTEKPEAKGKTHCTTELCSTVWTLSYQTKNSRVAAGFGLELAAFLSGHDE